MAGQIHVIKELNEHLTVEVRSGRKFLVRKDGGDALPGEPLLKLKDNQLLPRLRKMYLTPELDQMAPYLRFIATPRSSHVFPLHFQAARGRKVIGNEYHRLHLVWYDDRYFVKPIAPYLFSAAFWEWIAEADMDVYRAAAGFMRTYTLLVRSESDYHLMRSDELSLLPFSMRETTTFEQFVEFMAGFRELSDDEVSARYSYGELRLSRLNWLVRFRGAKMTYFHVHGQWRPYFMDLLAPLVAAFATLSLILSAMQVGLAVQSLSDDKTSQAYMAVCSWFSVIVLVLTTSACLGVAGLVAGVFISEQVFAYRVYQLKRQKNAKGDEIKTGVI
ncbi:hypothetical protein F4803DRAFT_535897 [Xylaria telfairii]|nr:hypothetical protein F4803DRAFT_535897 [Xylaria telfairii]